MRLLLIHCDKDVLRSNAVTSSSLLLTTLCTRKSDRDAISLSSSRVADVADGFTDLNTHTHIHTGIQLNYPDYILTTLFYSASEQRASW